MEHENTQVVQTCWAAMALMYAEYPEAGPIEKAVHLVMARQLPVSRFPTVLLLIWMLTLLLTLTHRTARGRRKRSRASSTGAARSRTRTTSSRSRSGCWAARIITWRSCARELRRVDWLGEGRQEAVSGCFEFYDRANASIAIIFEHHMWDVNWYYRAV